MERTQEAWRCNECYSAHEDEDAARDCCMPTIAEGYICTVCKHFYEDADEAADCCDAEKTAAEEEDIEPLLRRRLTPEELAAQGRLF